MNDFTPSKTANLAMSGNARRSTRVLKTVRLKVLGESRVGSSQVELTSVVAFNCHGCLYTSRHGYPPGSWVTLEVSNQPISPKPGPVRAQVRFVRLPRSPRELYCVGVELESPANVWGIQSAPDDWLPYSDSVTISAGAAQEVRPPMSTATDEEINILPDSIEVEPSALASESIEPTPQASAALPGSGTGERAAVSPEEMIRALEEKLQQAAEKAVASAVASQLHPAMNEALKAIESASQEGVRKIEARLRHRETLPITPRADSLSRLEASLANAGERLRTLAGMFFGGTQRTVQGVEISTAQAQAVLAEALIFSEKLASGQINVQAGGDVRYWINIDTTKILRPVIVGSFRASGGSRNDISAILAVECEFENWINGHKARVLFATDKVTTGQIQVPITQSGTYILAFNNRFSLSTPKTVAARHRAPLLRSAPIAIAMGANDGGAKCFACALALTAKNVKTVANRSTSFVMALILAFSSRCGHWVFKRMRLCWFAESPSCSHG